MSEINENIQEVVEEVASEPTLIEKYFNKENAILVMAGIGTIWTAKKLVEGSAKLYTKKVKPGLQKLGKKLGKKADNPVEELIDNVSEKVDELVS